MVRKTVNPALLSVKQTTQTGICRISMRLQSAGRTSEDTQPDHTDHVVSRTNQTHAGPPGKHRLPITMDYDVTQASRHGQETEPTIRTTFDGLTSLTRTWRQR